MNGRAWFALAVSAVALVAGCGGGASSGDEDAAPGFSNRQREVDTGVNGGLADDQKLERADAGRAWRCEEIVPGIILRD